MVRQRAYRTLFFYARNSPSWSILRYNYSIMRYMKWIGAISASLLVVSCFFPWVVIHSKNIIVTGVNAEGTNFGKPAYFHFLLVAIYLFLHFNKRLWAKRLNLAIPAINMAWATRNYFMVSLCRGGECPEKQIAIWIVVLSSLLMLLAALFPDMDTAKKN